MPRKWFKVLPYQKGSQSAKLLAQGLGVKRINLRNTSLRHPENLIVFNWGNASNVPHQLIETNWINYRSCRKTKNSSPTWPTDNDKS